MAPPHVQRRKQPGLRHMDQVVSNYDIVAPIAPGNYHFTGNSVGQKAIVKHVFGATAPRRTLLDIGFGVGDLGRIVKQDADTAHWHVDGVEGYGDACCNTALFAQRHYRNIWRGLAQDLAAAQLQSYDLLCLFDVIEHLDATAARALLHRLLQALGPDSRLVLSTPLWFWPQSQQNAGDLEEHLIAVPAQSLLLLAPLMYFIDSRFLVGTFVLSRRSLDLLHHFQPTTDRQFGLAAGRAHLQALGRHADDTLYFVA